MRPAALVVLLAACGGGRASAPEAEAAADSTPIVAVTLPPDTTYPQGRRGALVARSALPSALSGDWQPTAGVCHDPPSFHLLASGDSVDLMIVLRLPAEGLETGAYAVAAPEDTTASPRTAHLGVQRPLYADRGYRSERGSVELSRLNRLASGRFDVLLSDVTSQDTIRYLGVFERIRVDSLRGADCQTAARDVPPGVH